MSFLDGFFGEMAPDRTGTPTPTPAPAKARTIVTQNNHGALEDGSFAASQPGYIPPKPGEKRRFAVYDTVENGNAAQVALLGTRGYAGQSVRGVVSRYLGSGAENSAQSRANYMGYVSARLGIDADTPVPPEKRALMAQAMREFETGRRDPNVKFTPVSQENGNGGQGSDTPYTPDSMPAQARDMSKLAPTQTEQAQVSQGNKFTVADPFQMGPEIAADNAQVGQRGAYVDQALSGLIETMNTIQPQREAALQTAVAGKKALNAEIRDETQGLLDRARPLFQRREAIAARQVELASMSPLRRAISGVFNPNYNAQDLRARDYAAKNMLDVLAQDYTYATGLQDTLGKLIDADYNNQNAVWTLKTDSMNQDVQLLSQSFGLSRERMSAAMQGLDDQMGLFRAQVQARQDTLSQMTPAQVNVALEKAQKSPNGYAEINGVPLSINELQQQQIGYQAQEDAIESRQLALQGGRIDLANRYEDQLISHMTPPQIEEAIQNGGAYRGQQLDVGKLTNAYGALKGRQEQQAASLAQQSAPGVMSQTISGINTAVMGTTQRMMGLFGTIPDEQRQLMSGISTEIASITEGFKAANAQGIGAQYAQQNMARLQGLVKQQDAMITDSAKRWAGGNKDIQAVGEAWLRGQPVTSDAAVRGLIAMTRNGVPAGTNLSGPAAQTFKVVQNIVRNFDSPATGTDVTAMLAAAGSQKNKDDRAHELQRLVGDAVRADYNDRMMDTVLKATPQIARQIKIGGGNGAPHPFTRVDPQDFANAQAYGDQEGYARIATDLGIKPNEAQQMFAEGINGAIWQRVKKAKGWNDSQLGAEGRQLLALQTQAMLQALDASPSAKADFKPSAAFNDLLQRSEYQNGIAQIVRNNSSSSFGDYMISGGGGGDFNESFRNYAQMVAQGYATNRGSNLKQIINQQHNLLTQDPFKRAETVIAAMDGISAHDRQTFLNAIRGAVEQQAAGTIPTMDEAYRITSHDRSPNDSTGHHFDRDTGRVDPFDIIQDFILNKRFSDPGAEALRKRIAPQWIISSTALDRIATHIQGNV